MATINSRQAFSTQAVVGSPGLGWAASGSRSGTALSTAYSHGVSGSGFALRWVAPDASPINEAYIFLSALAGVGHTMRCRIYNESGSTIPGSTLRATASAVTVPGSANKWAKATFGTPYTPAVGEILWFVWDNTTGTPGTNYMTVLTSTTAETGPTRQFTAYTTLNGFTSGSAASDVVGVIVTSAGVYGQPFTQRNTTPFTSNALRRGFVFQMHRSAYAGGIVFDSAFSTATAMELLDSATAPGGSAIQTFTMGSDLNETTDRSCGCKIFDAPVALAAGKTYRWVFTVSGATTAPVFCQIEDYSSYSSVFDQFYACAALPYACQDNGAGGWTDSKQFCFSGCLIEDAVAPSPLAGVMRGGFGN